MGIKPIQIARIKRLPFVLGVIHHLEHGAMYMQQILICYQWVGTFMSPIKLEQMLQSTR